MPPRLTRPITGVRNAYASHEAGATGYYADEGARYVNPHDGGVREMLARATRDWPELWGMGKSDDFNDDDADGDEFGDRILDLSCGSGEVTSALVAAGVPLSRIDACDPYTHEAYRKRVGTECERWSFEDVARGAVADRRWRVVVCSFAMHLCARDYLPTLCVMLACSAKHLVLLTPHKRPVIDAAWGGWRLARRGGEGIRTGGSGRDGTARNRRWTTTSGKGTGKGTTTTTTTTTTGMIRRR